MPSSILNSDDGVISGTSGLKSTGGDDGVLNIQNNGTTAVTVNASGNVGIGTSSPGTRLHIADSSGGGSGRIRMSCTVSASYDSRIFQDDTGLNFSAVSDSRSLVFRTGNSDVERARITGAGDFQMNSGYGSVATAYGCRAWVNFDGTGTPAIREDGNVSSITDNGTGDYTVNFTTAMPDANYGVSTSTGINASNAQTLTVGTRNTSSVKVFSYNNSDVLVDSDFCGASIFR